MEERVGVKSNGPRVSVAQSLLDKEKRGQRPDLSPVAHARRSITARKEKEAQSLDLN